MARIWPPGWCLSPTSHNWWRAARSSTPWSSSRFTILSSGSGGRERLHELNQLHRLHGQTPCNPLGTALPGRLVFGLTAEEARRKTEAILNCPSVRHTAAILIMALTNPRRVRAPGLHPNKNVLIRLFHKLNLN